MMMMMRLMMISQSVSNVVAMICQSSQPSVV